MRSDASARRSGRAPRRASPRRDLAVRGSSTLRDRRRGARVGCGAARPACHRRGHRGRRRALLRSQRDRRRRRPPAPTGRLRRRRWVGRERHGSRGSSDRRHDRTRPAHPRPCTSSTGGLRGSKLRSPSPIDAAASTASTVSASDTLTPRARRVRLSRTIRSAVADIVTGARAPRRSQRRSRPTEA